MAEITQWSEVIDPNFQPGIRVWKDGSDSTDRMVHVYCEACVFSTPHLWLLFL